MKIAKVIDFLPIFTVLWGSGNTVMSCDHQKCFVWKLNTKMDVVSLCNTIFIISYLVQKFNLPDSNDF